MLVLCIKWWAKVVLHIIWVILILIVNELLTGSAVPHHVTQTPEIQNTATHTFSPCKRHKSYNKSLAFVFTCVHSWASHFHFMLLINFFTSLQNIAFTLLLLFDSHILDLLNKWIVIVSKWIYAKLELKSLSSYWWFKGFLLMEGYWISNGLTNKMISCQDWCHVYKFIVTY